MRYILFTMMLILLIGCSKPKEDEIEVGLTEMLLINSDLIVKTFGGYEIPNENSNFKIDTLKEYWIGKYEVTNVQYSLFVGSGGYSNDEYWSSEGWQTKEDSSWNTPKYWADGVDGWEDDPHSFLHDSPVHGISWYEAEAYCQWLTEQTGELYRMPTEPEWVRAARGPGSGYMYPWGDEYIEDAAFRPLFVNDELISVSSLQNGRSLAGAYHMIGNATEMTLESNWHPGGEAIAVNGVSSVLCSYDPCLRETMCICIRGYNDYWTRRKFGGFRICRESPPS